MHTLFLKPSLKTQTTTHTAYSFSLGVGEILENYLFLHIGGVK